jgi:cysteine desulfurase/selenocysteine lyase
VRKNRIFSARFRRFAAPLTCVSRFYPAPKTKRILLKMNETSPRNARSRDALVPAVPPSFLRNNAPMNVEQIRRDFPVLARKVHGKPLVYLDNSATSQKPQAMIDRMTQIYAHEYARVEEGHELSMEATKSFEKTRGRVAKLLNAAEPREIVFCRGATEALNLVSRMVQHQGLGPGDEILVTELEHHANIGPWLMICQESGASLKVVPITASADLDLDRLEEMLTPAVKFLAVRHVSNVTGGINPVKKITAMAHAKGIMVLVDGAQAVPHFPVNVRDIGCEFYAGSGHKMGGPSSVGFLYGRADVMEKMPLADSGSTMAQDMTFETIVPKPLPDKYEAGEPPFSEVESWGAAIDYWNGIGLTKIEAYERELTEYARGRVAAIPGVRLLGNPIDRISVLSFVAEGHDPKELEKALDREGIAVRAGNLEAAPLLRALGTDKAVRASFMFYNTHEEADKLALALTRILHGPAAETEAKKRLADQAASPSPPSERALFDWRSGAAVAGVALAGAALYNHLQARRAEAENPPIGRFVDVDGVPVQIVERGSGPAVLLIHGNGAMVGDWEASGVIDALAADHRVIALDRPGFGHTPRPRSRIWTPAAQAGLIAKALDALGVEKAVVVGHSWGVLPALALALDFPERVAGLVLVSGVFYPQFRADIVTSLPSAVPGVGDVILHTITPLLASATSPMQSRTVFEPAPVAERFSDFPMEMSLRPSQMRAQVNETVTLPLTTGSLARRYGELKLPITIVTGEGDAIVQPEGQSERLHREIPGSRLIVLPGMGHMVNYSGLDPLTQAIREVAAEVFAEA